MSSRPCPPLRSLIVGLGRSGLEVHTPALSRLRASGDDKIATLFEAEPVLGYDSSVVDLGSVPDDDLEQIESLARATEVAYPGNTVVHVCTPPSARPALLSELAQRGFRLMVLDNPLATDADSLRQVLAVATKYRLRIGIVAPWLYSGITRRLLAAVGDNRFGGLRRIAVRQNQPRLRRTFAAQQQPNTALDIEPPQSLALALALAGNGEVVSSMIDNTPIVDGRWVADMGSATLTIQHRGGVVTEISSDLAAPVWEQRVLVEFERGAVECYYPLGAADDHAQMTWMPERGPSRREIFADDAVRQGLLETYRLFVSESWPEPSLRLHTRVVELLLDAKAQSRTAAPAAPTPPALVEQNPPERPSRRPLPQNVGRRQQPPPTPPKMPAVSSKMPAVQNKPAAQNKPAGQNQPAARRRSAAAKVQTEPWTPQSRVLRSVSRVS